MRSEKNSDMPRLGLPTKKQSNVEDLRAKKWNGGCICLASFSMLIMI
ncbi:MAG: hypothetical protein CM15mP12_7440 [Gammaproteobacteria bacterium]|nr:MAG: hypothetical protein CM15mP12_7440 [Gammaproteobacteria bacterium]